MNWIEDAVAEFGRTMNLKGLAFNNRNVVCLDFEVMGSLYIEYAPDGSLLMYLSRTLPVGADLRQAAAACHYRADHPVPLHIALRDRQTLVYLARIEARLVTASMLERMMNLLARLHDQLATGGKQ